MIKELIKLANDLDARGLMKEADHLDAAIRRVAHTGRFGGRGLIRQDQPLYDPRPTDPYGDEMSAEEQDAYDAELEDRVKRVMAYGEELLLASEGVSSMKEFYDYGMQPAEMTAHPDAQGLLEYQLEQRGAEEFLELYENKDLLDELETAKWIETQARKAKIKGDS